MEVTDFREEHAAQVAGLHIEGISTGFITSLGPDFVTCLYRAIAHSRKSFGYVVEDNGKVLGFITITANLKELYKSMLLRKGIRFAFLLAGKMFSLKQIKKLFETLFYPSRVEHADLPDAELLSVVVDAEQRRRGLGVALMQRSFEECRSRGIERLKVMVGSANEPAKGLYSKCGYGLVRQIESHGVPSNLYVGRTSTPLLKTALGEPVLAGASQPEKFEIKDLPAETSRADAEKRQEELKTS